MPNEFKANDYKQPRFGILRPIGDFDPNSSDEDQEINLSEHDQKILALKDLWKLDEHIHTEHKFNELTDKELKQLSKEQQAEYQVSLSKFKKIQSIYTSAAKKQNYKCHFCGFFDEKFLEIHHLSGDHADNTESNIVAACTLCHRQHHLLWLALHNHAHLGLFNENSITQTELNHLQRISIVLEHHSNEEIRGRYGLNGKLGLAIKASISNFERPTPYHLISSDDKEAFFLKRNPTYKNFDYLNPSELDPNLSEEAREKQLKAIQSKYDELKKLSVTEQRKSIKESTNFSVFELSLALRNLSWKDYESFNPLCLKLCFTQYIFTKEQIEYYLTLPHFNPNNWQYLNNNFNQSDL